MYDAQDAAASITAFRTSEKRYQLHLEQQTRVSKGRKQRVTHVPRTTDLSGVIDVRNLAGEAAAALGATAVPVHGLPDGSCFEPILQLGQQPQLLQATGAPTSMMLLFEQHPGLAVFPAALPALFQLQLMQAALQDWPEPPARTNHTAAYGSLLCGLFQSAQAGLSLKHQPPQQQQQQEQDSPTVAGQSKCHQVQQQQQQHNNCAGQAPAHQHENGITPAAAAVEELGCRMGSACCLQQPGHNSGVSSTRQQTPDVWSGSGLGPKAALLLRKLRWVCLGPPYNWTDRAYEPQLLHTPLPQGLVALARHYARLAADGSAAGAALQEAAAEAAADAAAGAALAAPAAAGAADAAAAGWCAAQGASFEPDAALVNYYHAGDTLSGHKDDVEPDMRQPIVTLSLGCDAVFLMGGATRDVPPTPLLLRSGDVVVLGGAARRCYHGVPRIFDGWEPPAGVLTAAEVQQYAACVQHMRHSRINISIRSIH